MAPDASIIQARPTSEQPRLVSGLLLLLVSFWTLYTAINLQTPTNFSAGKRCWPPASGPCFSSQRPSHPPFVRSWVSPGLTHVNPWRVVFGHKIQTDVPLYFYLIPAYYTFKLLRAELADARDGKRWARVGIAYLAVGHCLEAYLAYVDATK